MMRTDTHPGARREWVQRREALYRTLLRPPPRLTLSEWADQHRVLSPEASPEPGPWRTSRAPYLREIMDTLSHPLVRRVVWEACSQVGKTEVVNNLVGYHIDQDPAPILVVQPSLDMAKDWSKDRLAPMLRDSPTLRDKVKSPRARDAGNTLFHKNFSGGHLTVVGANSASGLSSRPIRIVLPDEVDRYPPSAGSEGDPVSLAEQRARNFWNKKIFLVSTPRDLETSRIHPEFLESDQRRFHLPCPHCGEFQVLVWGNLKWDTDEKDGERVHRPETAMYACEECGALIDETEKTRMLAGGEWRSMNPDGKFPGFHINALYSPWVRWEELVELWLKVQGKPEQLKTFVNLQLGEPWKERDEDLEPENLAALAERYEAEVPDGVGLLTAGVDVQGDWIEISVRGWGKDEESWLITHQRINGDPEADEVWADLERILTKAWKHPSGQDLRIRVAFIDAGYLPDVVDKFVAPRQRRGVFAIMGVDTRQAMALKRAQRKNKKGAKRYTLDTVLFKTRLFRRLKRTVNSHEPGGPQSMHFCGPTSTGADAEYFAQFGAEIRTRTQRGGQYVIGYKQIRKRNEAIDLEVYALAALYSLPDQVRKSLGDLADQARVPPADREEESPPPKRKRRSGWVNKW